MDRFHALNITAVVWVLSATAIAFPQTVESPYVSYLRQLSAALIRLDSDAAIRDWIINQDSELKTKRSLLEATVTSLYPSAMRPAKLEEAIAAEYEPLLATKVAAFKRARESVHCDDSLFTPHSTVVDIEFGSMENGVAIVFATIQYPERTRKFMPSEAYPSEGQRTKSDKVFSGLNDEEWYWLKSAIVRLVLYRQTPPGTRDINNSSFVLSACSFVGVSVYGSAMAESNQPQRTVNPAVTKAVAIREVQPVYTSDAKRAKVQGSVWLEVTVMPDGTVGDVKVVRSLDPIFGLDQAAIEAAKQWRFRPGMRGNQPTESKLTIELTFTLR